MQTPIETLDMDVRMYNQIKRERIDTVEQLLGRMYQPEGIKHFSTRFQRDIERVLKQKGLLAYTRGEYAAAEDVYSTPLTWEQLHSMTGKLVAVETFAPGGTPSRYRVCWVYDFNAEDDRVQIQYGNEYAAATPSSNFYALKDFPLPEKNTGKAAPTLAETAGAAPEIQEAEIVPQEAAPLADDAASAWTLHRRIMANISALAQSLAQMCQDIKKMRDTRLYKAMGYDTFEAYTEQEIGIKRRQAYTYISIAEKLPEDFVRDTAQIGVQKLALLASITADQRETITAETDLQNTTVKQLKSKIADIAPSQDIPGQLQFVPDTGTEIHAHAHTDTGTQTDTTQTQAHTDTDTGTQAAQKQALCAENPVEDVETEKKEFERLLQNVENALDDICIFLDDSGKGTKEMNQKLWRMLIDYAGALES